MKIITQNKKAYFDYEVLDTMEAGLVLNGDEVKSLKAGHGSLIGAFATFHGGELFLLNASITPYSHAFSKAEEETNRSRKLLLHKRELMRLLGEISKKGVTVIPLKLYLNKKNLIKVELGVCKHKKAHNKKDAIKERDIDRQTKKELKGIYKY